MTSIRPTQPPVAAPARTIPPQLDDAPKAVLVVNGWANCPNCKQSATGTYINAFGCTRCGWSSRPQAPKKRVSF